MAYLTKGNGTAKAKLKDYVRTGVLYATVATSIMIISVPTSSDLGESAVKLVVNPQVIDLRTTRESYIDEAKEVADESFKKTGRYDVRELRRIQSKYFSFLKKTDTPLEPLLEPIIGSIENISKSKGLDPALVGGVIDKESAAFPYAVGAPPYYALGLMQINPLAHKLPKEQYAHIFDKDINIDLGATILKKDIDAFPNNLTSALNSYYGRTDMVTHTKVPKKTKYSERVIDHRENIRNLYRRNF
jgi:soluble lytic murein transglycosylase-like protein